MEYSEGIYDISDLKFKYPDMWYCESIFDENNCLIVNIKIDQKGKACHSYQMNFGKTVFFQQVEESWFDMVDTTIARWKNVDSQHLLFEIKNSTLIKELTDSKIYNTSFYHYFMTTTNWYLEVVTCNRVNIN